MCGTKKMYVLAKGTHIHNPSDAFHHVCHFVRRKNTSLVLHTNISSRHFRKRSDKHNFLNNLMIHILYHIRILYIHFVLTLLLIIKCLNDSFLISHLFSTRYKPVVTLTVYTTLG